MGVFYLKPAFEEEKLGAEKTAQQLRECTVLAEDLGLVPSTHVSYMVSYNHL